MKASKKFDIVLYGATGFTGKLVAAYLDQHPNLANKNWAIAGRTPSKLSTLQNTLSSTPPIKVVALDDTAAVEALVDSTRVIITCAGPYSLYNGEALLSACARGGVHYSDLAGEGFWQRVMCEKYHDIAKQTGAKIVLGGGIDSIPSDLATMMVLNAMGSRDTDPVTVSGVYTRYCGSFSGGTLNSGRAAKKAKSGGMVDYPYSKEMENDPYLLSKGVTGVDNARQTGSGMQAGFSWMFSATYGVICNFFMAPINARVVRRSLYLRNEQQYISYSECCSLYMWIHVVTMWSLRGFGYFLGEPINFKPKSGEGPPSWLLRDGEFAMTVTATSLSGNTAVATVAGQGDPGYGATSKLLSELGLCLAFDSHEHEQCTGGVLTPSTAVGGAYVKRLQSCDFMNQIEVVSGGNKKKN